MRLLRGVLFLRDQPVILPVRADQVHLQSQISEQEEKYLELASRVSVSRMLLIKDSLPDDSHN